MRRVLDLNQIKASTSLSGVFIEKDEGAADGVVPQKRNGERSRYSRKPGKYRIGAFLVLVFFFVVTHISLAQNQSPLNVEVDLTDLTTDDVVNLTITISGSGNIGQPDLPALPQFSILSSGRSSQFNLVNGVMSSQIVHSYVLRPLEVGDLVIGPVEVDIDGQTYESDPIMVKVSQGTSAVQPVIPTPEIDTEQLRGSDFFVEAEVDNADPYVGEMIVYTFRFYNARRISGQPRYDSPEFTGFWHEQQPEQNQYTLRFQDRVYRITELQTILFPTRPGPVTIDPSSLDVEGLGEFQTETIDINVLPLATTPPDDYRDAVGLFSIEAETDLSIGRVNEPITLLVTLSGQGNLYTLSDPIWPEIPGWRTFEDETSLDARFENGRVSGSKVYKRLLVPGEMGDFVIPAISYTYFDPNDSVYRTVSTEAIPVNILAGSEEPPIFDAAGTAREAVERQASDIRHIKPVPENLETAEVLIPAQNNYWMAWLIPLAFLALSVVWLQGRGRRASRKEMNVATKAGKKAQKALNAAQKGQDDPYSAAGQILITYLSERTSEAVGGLTQDELASLLQQHGVEDSVIERVKHCLNESDMGRFGPSSAQQEQAARLLEYTSRLISDLEKEFQS